LPLTPYFKPLLLRQFLQRILLWRVVVGVALAMQAVVALEVI
jgi:hypothetical protein